LWVFVIFLLFSEPFRGFIKVAISASIHSFFPFVELLYLIGFQPKDSSSGSSKIFEVRGFFEALGRFHAVSLNVRFGTSNPPQFVTARRQKPQKAAAFRGFCGCS
jgi:hypothetical protein